LESLLRNSRASSSLSGNMESALAFLKLIFSENSFYKPSF
jgi:hypothetical protein